MALPTTGYATATVTNPSSALTDFTLMVDLSRMPASWWAAVDTADGTKGRAATAGGTELACDWIAFDNSGETGWLRVLWTGSLASSGTQVLRIYPPVAANASVAAGATYGQYAAYDASWPNYYPDGGGTNRKTGTASTALGGVTVGGATGKTGAGTTFDGSNDGVNIGASVGNDTTITLSAWVKTSTGNTSIIAKRDGTTYGWQWLLGSTGKPSTNTPGNLGVSANTAVTDNAWHHVVMTTSGGVVTFYLDGNSDGSGNFTPTDQTMDVCLGARWNVAPTVAAVFAGILDDCQLHTAPRSAAWIAEEYAQTNDQAAFWGTWGWTAGTPYYYNRRRAA